MIRFWLSMFRAGLIGIISPPVFNANGVNGHNLVIFIALYFAFNLTDAIASRAGRS